MTGATIGAAPEVVPSSVLDDLRARLRAYRRVALSPGTGWDRGVDGDFLAELVEHWAERYDWRTHEERIRALPWEHHGSVRLIHQRGGANDVPVVLLHGWPDSVLRFEKVLPLLRDSNVVVPALPGYPFAAPVAQGGLSAAAMAEEVAAALADLGYDRYVVSAGDVGCDVAEVLAAEHPDHVAALHLTDVSQHRFRIDPPAGLSPVEQDYVRYGQRWQEEEGGYMHEQRTKPHTLAVGLGDSPAGLAAWLVEKLRTWTDCGGDVTTAFTRDELLTWVTAYWVSGAIGTSFTPYAESGPGPRKPITAPTAFTIFPEDLVNAPREFAERFFEVRSWVEHISGGHFAAWERPEQYVAGVRTAQSFA